MAATSTTTSSAWRFLGGGALADAAIYRTRVGAQNAIDRTVEAQQLARTSLMPDWKSFDALKFNQQLEVHEVLVDAEDAE